MSVGIDHDTATFAVQSIRRWWQMGRPAYPGGITVTDAQLATVRLVRHRFHGDWNYTIHPTTRKHDKSVIV